MPEDKPNTNDPLSGLLGALLGGHPAVQEHMQTTGQSVDQVLGNITNAANPSSAVDPTGGSLGDILGSVLGGGQQAGNAPSTGAAGDPLSSILGGLMGGSMQSSETAQSGSSDPLGSILGGLLGGGMPQGGAPMQNASALSGGDSVNSILGGLLGGGMQGGTPSASVLGNNAFLAPIVEAIAGKTGVSPQIAETVVSFALTQLMSGQGNSQLAQMLGGKGNISQKYLRDSGLANQLAQRTGLDNKTATKSLQQVLQAFGTQMGEGTMDDRQRGLQGWLETK